MAFLSHIQFGDNSTGLYSKNFLVVDCHLHFTRHHNHFKPDTDARCEKVELVVVAPGKDDLNLQEWYLENESLSGRVIFDLQSQLSGETMVKLVEFEEAHCYSFEEEYHIDTQRRRHFRLSFVAEKISVNQIEFKNLFASSAT